MSRMKGNTFIIEEQPPEKCELCGAIEECRPYGPNGENICFSCGMKNKEAAEAAFRKRLTDGNNSVKIVAIPISTHN